MLHGTPRQAAEKNADMIVANQVGDGLAFGTDNNEGGSSRKARRRASAPS